MSVSAARSKCWSVRRLTSRTRSWSRAARSEKDWVDLCGLVDAGARSQNALELGRVRGRLTPKFADRVSSREFVPERRARNSTSQTLTGATTTRPQETRDDQKLADVARAGRGTYPRSTLPPRLAQGAPVRRCPPCGTQPTTGSRAREDVGEDVSVGIRR